MSFLFRRSWLALCLLSIFFSSFLCFLVKVITDTLPVRQWDVLLYYADILKRGGKYLQTGVVIIPFFLQTLHIFIFQKCKWKALVHNPLNIKPRTRFFLNNCLHIYYFKRTVMLCMVMHVASVWNMSMNVWCFVLWCSIQPLLSTPEPEKPSSYS